MEAIFEIPLGNGGVAIVSECDSPLLMEWPWSWHRSVRGYAQSAGNGKPVRLHRLILGFPASAIDHINGNKLDNRRSNLRLCTNAQNQWNRPGKPHSSRFKGVTVNRVTGKFEAQIWCHGKRHYLGTFTSDIDAARARDEAARKYHGEFARLNFPNEQSA
jgi:hypothetical protein